MARVGGEDIDLTPTDGMAKEAQKALDWRKDGFDGGTAVGLARARQLVNKQELSPSTVRRMHSFFSRHEVDKQGQGFSPGEPGFPSNGRVAWALWGGDPGQTWARAKSATLDRLEGKSIDYTKDYAEDEEVNTDFGASCPAVTHDDELNKTNHMVTIEQANLGPADPVAQSDAYWSFMAEKWMVSTDEARVRQCQNCEYYNNSPKVLDCLKSSTLKASDLPVTPKWADVSAPSGYCTKWDITCTSTRTCLSWEPGEEEKELDDMDDSEETVDLNEPLGGGPNLDDQMMLLAAKKATTKMFTFDTILKAVDTGQDGELKIEGYASSTAIDRSADVILASAWTKSGGLNNFQRNPILLFNHNYDKPIGKVIAMGTDSRGLKINGVISKSAGDVYNLVKEGVLSTFSVGFLIKDAEYDKQNDGLIIKDAELLEISVVSVPCNQDATFSVAKSFDSQNDYLTFRKQFENATSIQPIVESEGSSEVAEKASRKIKMDDTTNEMIQKAVSDALAAKSAADAALAEKAVAEKASTDKIVAQVIASSEEKLFAELEKRFKDDNTDLNAKLDGLRTELAEKSVELQNLATSKRVFADRSGSNNSWEKEFGKEADDAYLLGRITGKGYNTDFARNLLEKVNAHSSVQVSTDNFEREVSISIERDIQNELILAPMFREIVMTTASMVMPIMPDTNYATISTAAALPGTPANGTMDARGAAVGAGAGVALTEIELRTIKMIAKSYLGNETEEDAILPILPLLREGMIRQHARGVENLILLGGAADGAYPTVSATAATGLLKYATTGGRSVTAAGTATPLTAAVLLTLRKAMGKYGLRPNDVAYIVSQQCYFELLEDAEFQDFNLVNTQATKLTGEVGQIFGSSVMVCDEFPAAATGKFHALAVNTRNFVVPRLRGVTVESQYLVENQHKVLATTQRLGFKEIIPDAKSVIGLKYA
jgi:HK97 family phage prohead protease